MSTTGELLKAANVKGAKRKARREARREWLNSNREIKLGGLAVAGALFFIVGGAGIGIGGGRGLAGQLSTGIICLGIYLCLLVAVVIVCSYIISERR